MTVGVCAETPPEERRVALVPSVVGTLVDDGVAVAIEAGAGLGAGFPDAEYEGRGARVVAERQQVLDSADVFAFVRPPDSAAELRAGQTIVGLMNPLGSPALAGALATANVRRVFSCRPASLKIIPIS